MKLEDYPLAVEYGWAPRRGPPLYVYPPRAFGGAGRRSRLSRRLLSVDPEELTPRAREIAGGSSGLRRGPGVVRKPWLKKR